MISAFTAHSVTKYFTPLSQTPQSANDFFQKVCSKSTVKLFLSRLSRLQTPQPKCYQDKTRYYLCSYLNESVAALKISSQGHMRGTPRQQQQHPLKLDFMRR